MLAAVTAEVVAWSAALVVGVVLIAAGGLKLAAGDRWPAQARDLGVAAPLAAVVPWAELVVGAAVATRIADPLGAVVAATLLGAFTAFLVRRIAAGRSAPCACFGSWSTRPVGWTDVGRNLVLIALAVVVVVVG